MKVAIYFSGRVNKYEYSLDYLKFLGNRYNVDFFCSLNIKEIDDYHNTFLTQLKMKNYFYQEHNDVFKKDWYVRFNRLQSDHPHVWYKISSSFFNNQKAFELIEDTHGSSIL